MRKSVLIFALVSLSAALAARADVHGIAFGFVQSVTLNFDGMGGCRMVLTFDRDSIIDFPAGELAESCAKRDIGTYTEIIVDDAPGLLCVATSRFIAASTADNPPAP